MLAVSPSNFLKRGYHHISPSDIEAPKALDVQLIYIRYCSSEAKSLLFKFCRVFGAWLVYTANFCPVKIDCYGIQFKLLTVMVNTMTNKCNSYKGWGHGKEGTIILTQIYPRCVRHICALPDTSASVERVKVSWKLYVKLISSVFAYGKTSLEQCPLLPPPPSKRVTKFAPKNSPISFHPFTWLTANLNVINHFQAKSFVFLTTALTKRHTIDLESPKLEKNSSKIHYTGISCIWKAPPIP